MKEAKRSRGSESICIIPGLLGLPVIDGIFEAKFDIIGGIRAPDGLN